MMERWPPWLTLFFISIFTLCPDGEAQSAFTIDWVKLTILPGNALESGTNVTLHCEAKVSHSFSRLTHTFTFFVYNTVIYSKNSSEAVVELRLTPARASNSGSYKCIVQIDRKEKTSNTQTLNVTGLQVPQLTVQSNMVYEGNSVQATCSAPKETGSLSFFFYKNGEVFANTLSKNNSATTPVDFQNLGEYNLHCMYREVHSGSVSNISNTVKVTVRELNFNTSVMIKPAKDVVEGDRVLITCSVAGHTHKEIEIFLTKDNLVIHHSHTSFTHGFEARANHSGEYVCKAETGNVQRTSTAELVVEELFSRPVLSMTPGQVFEGQMFTLNCRVSTISQKRITPTDMSYIMYKNQRSIKKEHAFNITGSQSNNGNYACASEAKGITKTSDYLTISAKVPVSPPVITAVGQVIVGKPFQLRCKSEHGTLPIIYDLLMSGKLVDRMNVTGPQRSALFNISGTMYPDEIRSFTCQAQNQGAAQHKSSQALNSPVTEPVSKPELAFYPKGHSVTEGTEVSLNCSVKQGTVPVTFTWYRSGSTKPLYTTRIYKTQGSHTIKPITRDDRGRYYCEASNDANETRTSEPVPIGVNFAAWKKAVIAVICVLILVLIITILVLFLRKARTPRKRKRAVELSVKSPRPKSNDPMRMSLTLDIEDNTAINSTPGVMGRNVWSENVSDSESNESSKEENCEKVEYTDMKAQQTVIAEEVTPMMQDTDTVNGEVVQNCTQDAIKEDASDSAVEYVQLNHSEHPEDDPE